jgi:hypothetical protein
MALYPKIGFLAWTDKTSETKPMAGRIIIYTSGCPKNQNKCWYKIGLPPTLSSACPAIKMSLKKKLVPRLRSNINIKKA